MQPALCTIQVVRVLPGGLPHTRFSLFKHTISTARSCAPQVEALVEKATLALRTIAATRSPFCTSIPRFRTHKHAVNDVHSCLPQDEALVEQAAAALRAIAAASQPCCHEIARTAGLSDLIGLLRSPNATARAAAKAAGALAHLAAAGDDVREAMLQAGAIGHLVALLNHGECFESYNLLMVCSLMVHGDNVREGDAAGRVDWPPGAEIGPRREFFLLCTNGGLVC